MPWARLEADFYQNPKIVELPDGALALYVSAIGYAVQHLTDGRLTRSSLAVVRPLTRRSWLSRWAMTLVRAGLWHEDGDGFIIHDFDRYQPTKAQVEADREAARGRMRRLRSGERSSEQASNARAAFGRSSRPHPIPSQEHPPDPRDAGEGSGSTNGSATRTAVRAVACPACGAASDTRCVGPAGERESNHAERVEAHVASIAAAVADEGAARRIESARSFGRKRSSWDEPSIRADVERHFGDTPQLAAAAMTAWQEARA